MYVQKGRRVAAQEALAEAASGAGHQARYY